jgi:predicted amidohydrolase YtcJ
VRSHIPAFTVSGLESMLSQAARRCAAVGLTGVHDAGTDVEVFRCLERLAARDELPVRVYGMLHRADPKYGDSLEHGPIVGERLWLRCAKFFLDGALGSRGAALFEDYSDEPGNRGLLTGPEDLAGALVAAMSRGFQVACHAIGDRANAQALDAIAEAQRRTGRRDLRPRIEHAQVLRAEDLPRFAREGIIASLQPAHAGSDAAWAGKRLGPERLLCAYPLKALRAAGAALAFGSDFPIEDVDPLRGLRAACELGSLSSLEALEIFTRGAAFASFREGESGSLAVGKLADLTALDRDVIGEPGALGEARARFTMVAGETSFGG